VSRICSECLSGPHGGCNREAYLTDVLTTSTTGPTAASGTEAFDLGRPASLTVLPQ